MSIYRDELMRMIDGWTRDQISAYITRLELRVTEMNQLLRELRVIRKRMSSATKTIDTGDRHG